jgi:hypothetical protein
MPNVHFGSIVQTTKKACNISTAKSIGVSPRMITGSPIFTPGFTMTTNLTWEGSQVVGQPSLKYLDTNDHRSKTVRWSKFLHRHSGKTRDHFLSWTPVELCSTASWDFNCQSSPLFPCRIRGTASSSVQLTVLGVGILKDGRGLA